VTLWICDRCHLQFVAAECPGACPNCRRNYSGHTVIRLAGQDIEIEAVRIYGDSAIKKALKGTDSAAWGTLCAWFHSLIYLPRLQGYLTNNHFPHTVRDHEGM